MDLRSPEKLSNAHLLDELRAAFESCDYRLDSGAMPSEQPTAPCRPLAELAAGTRFGDFVVEAELGRGGMGVVYRARQESLDRTVALKVMPTHSGAAADRFRQEAQAVARLSHPNIVRLFGHGAQEGYLFHALELLSGPGLNELIDGRTRLPRGSGRHERGDIAPVPEVPPPLNVWLDVDRDLQAFRFIARQLAEVARALQYAHDRGVLHRDIKPQNLIYDANGRLRVTDFGLAFVSGETRLTATGVLMGTPAYLSPEQLSLKPQAVDHRTDVYALGMTLYEALVGRPAFEGPSRASTIKLICAGDAVPPRRVDPHIPAALEAVCLAAIEKQPARRYQSSAALAQDLEAFAAGRRVQVRHTRPLQRALRRALRHRSLTVLSVAIGLGLLLLLGAGWRGVRVREAQEMTRAAYEQLVIRDYRQAERVMADIERAANMGAAGPEWTLARALAEIGNNQSEQAAPLLEQLVAEHPDHAAAWYMLAFARRRLGDLPGSAEAFRSAENAGDPTGADAWFLRGLAVHFDRPELAMESYRRAIALQAAEQDFYPQAELHLARAYNQHIYARRSLEFFDKAAATLGHLIERGYYGGYPHYLLSITHRLVGEIHVMQQQRGSEKRAAYHYAEALHWARNGQEAAPDDDRPLTAEAECLEKLGQYELAVEARTRAMELAQSARHRWEGLHYRWRLNYWLGRFEAALEDLRGCEGHDPDSVFYALLYPALVFAEMGDLETARNLVSEIHERRPQRALSAIWTASGLRILGQAAAGDELLAQHRDQVDYAEGVVPPQNTPWVEALYDLASGKASLEHLLELADDAATPRKLRAEAFFHAGARAFARADLGQARQLLRQAYVSFDSEQRYTYHARLLLNKMDDRSWPAWIEPADPQQQDEDPPAGG